MSADPGHSLRPHLLMKQGHLRSCGPKDGSKRGSRHAAHTPASHRGPSRTRQRVALVSQSSHSFLRLCSRPSPHPPPCAVLAQRADRSQHRLQVHPVSSAPETLSPLAKAALRWARDLCFAHKELRADSAALFDKDHGLREARAVWSPPASAANGMAHTPHTRQH